MCFFMCDMLKLRSLLLNLMYIGLITFPSLLIGLRYSSIYIRAEQSHLMYNFYGFNNYVYFAIIVFFGLFLTFLRLSYYSLSLLMPMV